MKYLAVYTWEEEQWSVTFPQFPGCVTCGNTLDEAMMNAQEALTGHVEAMKADGDQVPDGYENEELIMCVTID